jgi:hypothetical protein
MGGLFLTGAEGSRNDDVPDCSWRGLHGSEGDLQRRSGPWVHTGAESTEDCGVLFCSGEVGSIVRVVILQLATWRGGGRKERDDREQVSIGRIHGSRRRAPPYPHPVDGRYGQELICMREQGERARDSNIGIKIRSGSMSEEIAESTAEDVNINSPSLVIAAQVQIQQEGANPKQTPLSNLSCLHKLPRSHVTGGTADGHKRVRVAGLPTLHLRP